MVKLPKNDGLNIIPFIDIMLVLLAIVLSVSTFIAQGKINIDLPDSNAAQTLQDEKDKLEILIDKNSKFYINDNEISIEELKHRIENLDKSTLVELRSDKEAKFSSFVTLIDLLKLQKHEKFQIITEKNQ